jgi:hypothetical protein
VSIVKDRALLAPFMIEIDRADVDRFESIVIMDIDPNLLD